MSRRFDLCSAIILAVLVTSVSARDRADLKTEGGRGRMIALGTPAYCSAQHEIGNIRLTVSNMGTIGGGNVSGLNTDCFTGEVLRSCEFPKGSSAIYMYCGAIWVGAVVGGDTLVSCGTGGWFPGGEMYPDEAPFGAMITRSILDTAGFGAIDAVSEQDIIAVYTDTFTDLSGIETDEMDGRPHIPLHVEITQKSMAWSNPYAEDIVFLQYSIKNIGSSPLQELYVGMHVDADVLPYMSEFGFNDDISGFIGASGDTGQCVPPETLNIAWSADNDGDLTTGKSLPDITGLQMLRIPPDVAAPSFNWWVSNGAPQLDFGPMERDNVRDLGTGGTGTPVGDRSKYFFMRNGERDYDQALAGTIQSTDPVWTCPDHAVVYDMADGYDTKYLLSFGPLTIGAGDSVSFATAYVGGRRLHTDPNNAANNLNGTTYHPDVYYSNLDFSDFIFNARAAKKIYDTPGIDTDGDGYAGEFVVCDGDSVWISGDGVPDYRVPGPPPAPEVRCEALPSAIRVRWNGVHSETTRDPFDQKADFEGYRVYLSSDDGAKPPVEMGSFDQPDYLRYRYNRVTYAWECDGRVYTLRELRCRYAVSCEDDSFDPVRYTRSRPYTDRFHPIDSVFAFENVGLNAYKYGENTQVKKSYPNQPYPSSLNPKQAQPDELTPDGYLKYFEYEMVVPSLISDSCYDISVTAFDLGVPILGKPMLESSLSANVVRACTMSSQGCCLDGYTGNTNCDERNRRDLADVLQLIDYVFVSHTLLCCEAEGNVDGDAEGKIDLADILQLIDCVFISKEPAARCQ